jgi:ubiquinone/menaquinone biosynthesis C-methylase UbiE
VTYTETDLVATIERLAGEDLAALTQPQRDQLDQFHSGGSEAVDRLLPSLKLAPGMIVLDIGSGLGGPARQIARSSGCTVVGVDITPAYVDTAQALTHTPGLDDQVTFVCSDIASFDRTDFDAAYTMDVQMNVADKKTYSTEIARRLRPGARFATFEVCLTGDSQPTPPLPWSLDGTDSYLATADQLRETIASSGFEILERVDETQWVLEWFEELGKRIAAGGSPATLPAVLNDGPTRMMNFAVALTTGVVSVHRGSFILAT